MKIIKMLGWGSRDAGAIGNSLHTTDSWSVDTDGFLEWLRDSVLPDAGVSVLGRALNDMDRSLLDLDYHILNQTKDTMRHPEFGESVFISPDKSTVVTTPLTEIERRVRRGDDIDLAESMALDDPREWPTERFLPIPEPTYPYTSWAFSDGRREDVSITRKRELYEKVLQRLDPADVKAADFVSGALVRMAQESGYSDFDAYKSDLHPDVPILVICQLAYLGMANPIEAAHAVLRPCVYTRWDV